MAILIGWMYSNRSMAKKGKTTNERGAGTRKRLHVSRSYHLGHDPEAWQKTGSTKRLCMVTGYCMPDDGTTPTTLRSKDTQ
jgi:hypothetical protein